MNQKYEKFQKIVLDFYHKQGRHDLPWRLNNQPYYVLVSEVMLQQTQVSRVIPFFEKWIQIFPDIVTLANSPQSLVLKYWKGLGYNSRALRLHGCAKEIVQNNNGKIPDSFGQLVLLPGIGSYTASALCNFSYEIETPMIETNIRRVILHHFFKNKQNIHDSEIMNVLKKIPAKPNARIWYWALMDYGSELPKKLFYNPNIQSQHYTKQKPFKNSNRQIRGKILDFLLKEKNHKISKKKLVIFLLNYFHVSESEIEDYKKRYELIFLSLERDGFLKKEKQSYHLL